jgi:hypothetical protein
MTAMTVAMMVTKSAEVALRVAAFPAGCVPDDELLPGLLFPLPVVELLLLLLLPGLLFPPELLELLPVFPLGVPEEEEEEDT